MASPSQSVHSLRIQKGATSGSPNKASAIPRPLSELAPTEKRRNSPSFKQNTKSMTANGDSSPFQSSPFNNSADGNSSSRLFWKGREHATPSRFNAENLFARTSSPSPTRRSSIEKLQKASRVKNSNMFAREMKQEYDPISMPVIERPLAKQIQGNAYGGSGLDGLRSAERTRPSSHQSVDSKTSMPLYDPTQTPTKLPKSGGAGLRSPSKDQISPTKSSMSSGRFNPKSSYDSETNTWSEENSLDEKQLPPGRILHRHAKSVTFDAAPPQINEYEMATPDLSSVGTGSRENSYDSAEDEEGDSYNQGESFEQDDSFDASLEDTDKTPVVGPEDWRHGSPMDHDGMISGHSRDSLDGPDSSPMPDARPSSSLARPLTPRTDSMNSNGDHRPLPPLPGMARQTRNDSSSPIGLSAAAECATNSQRSLPSPAPAAVSKSDIQDMSYNKMSLEERLRLMMIDDDKPKTAAEQQRERRMRRAAARSSQTPEREVQANSIYEDEDTLDDLPGLDSYQLPPRISRESILRKVNSQTTCESDYNFSSPAPSSSPEHPAALDPDTPLPSTEDRSMLDDDNGSVIIKPEDEEEVDVYSIPEMYQRSESRLEDYDNKEMNGDEDADSQYSDPTPSNINDGNQPTPRANSPVSMNGDPVKEIRKGSLFEIPSLSSNNDFGLSLQSYMTPSPPPSAETKVEAPRMSQAQEYLQRPQTPEQRFSAMPEYDGTGWGPEEEEDLYDVGTPDSVIRHSLPSPPTPPRDSPVIPERIATIKSSNGTKLKTRPSATPSDIAAMRDIWRQVSGEKPVVPPIPQRHRNRPSMSFPNGIETSEENDSEIDRTNSLKQRSLTLDMGNDLGLSLDQDFDRVIEAQKVVFDQSSSNPTLPGSDTRQASNTRDHSQLYKFVKITPRKQRGYLMRQNTKLVVASSNVDKDDEFRGTRSCDNSPVKKDRPQSWTVEPWNGQARKSSIRDKGPRKKLAGGPVPPLPGQESNASGLGSLAEDAPTELAPEDGGERGRLFVKVIGVKNLDMPLPKNEQTWFSLTLDNGVHCVTTAWLELGRNAPVGQEFELVVPNELEFQLTLNAKLEKPAAKRVITSPTKAKSSKPSTFSRVFTSPKKRKELEMRQREEEERIAQQNQREAMAKRMSQQPTAWDLLSPLAAEDGSFGRSYVCLKDHETRCFGRPYIVDIACFNEWATEEASHSSSIMSKRGNTHVQRRAPYRVAKLELQLLFVPKPKGATDDDMPKSLNSCIREMKEAELALARNFEGPLSQQGGDCPYWRRRFFRLCGTKLTAYHESTRQPRATINLANACKLIDDRRALTQKETVGKGGKRRRSGFAEEEEGYMFVEEGFRIRFNNGEVIDFYADSAADKEGWMKVLDACIGKETDGKKRGWCDMVLRREESLMRKASGTAGKGRHHQRTKSMIV